MSYFVYKYVYNNKIIYIGLTDDMKRRVYEHASGVGIESKFLPYLDNVEIYYHQCGNETEMRALESLLINHFKPVLNVVDIHRGESTITIDIDWVLYDEKVFTDTYDNEIMKIRRVIKSNETRIANYRTEQIGLDSSMLQLRPFYQILADNMEALIRNPYLEILMPRSIVPKTDDVFICQRIISPWYDEQNMNGDFCSVQFSGMLLRELFAVGHMPDWIDKTMAAIGRDKYDEIEERIANLKRKNEEYLNKIQTLQNDNGA
ncbi:MAG: GIY-YIG nuclease family protein [Agathobacter sp.]|nr:GIY-YIG nuclease family protein [Agathobacter sp.]